MSSEDRAWHDSWKPSFSNSGVLVYAASGSTKQVSGELAPTMKPVVGERRDVRFAKFVPATDLNAMTLLAQKEATTIDTSSGFPLATAPSKLLFASLADNVDPQTKIATHETSIWKLCSILFDPLNVSASRFMQGVPEDKHDEFAERMRMDALSAYWADLTISFVQDGLKHARTAEEKALLYLTQNDVVAACEVLISARDFKLATLVSQLPGTDTSRTMMQGQIAEWRYRNDWSEMSDPVRALFSIIAGETWMVEGKGGAAENRAAGFSIAERFGLSWQQSFALQLFFGGHETIATAIQAYSADLNTDRDSAQPSKTWPNGNETRDIRVDVMRFYAGDTKDVMVLIDPLAVSGSSVSSRLTWQLATIFNARGICNVPQAQLDEITHDFAAEMETAGRLVNSAWILLHLTDRATREKAITGLLEREGERLSTPGQHDMHGTFEELVEDTHIPASLLWRAKAMYAKAGGDPALQADWLLRAGEVDEAHEVLCSTLGPQAVIERDYDVLGHVLQLFPRRLPEGWQQGGQVYSEFMRLVRAHAGQQVNTRRIEKGLALMEEHNQGKSREERVAILEMSRVLEQTMRENDEREGDKLAGMAFADANPLGADLLNRYQQVMST